MLFLVLATVGLIVAIYWVLGSYSRQLKLRLLKARFDLVKLSLLMGLNILAVALACYGIVQLGNSAPYFGWLVVSPVLSL